MNGHIIGHDDANNADIIKKHYHLRGLRRNGKKKKKG